MGDFERDRLIVAELIGEARHRSKWRPLTGEEEAAAVAELRLVAGDRADLLAEVCGILLGTSEGELDEPIMRQAAGLCLLAGADLEAIPRWVAEGRRRKASAGKPPFSAPKRKRPPRTGLGPGLAVADASACRCAIADLAAEPAEPRDGWWFYGLCGFTRRLWGV